MQDGDKSSSEHQKPFLESAQAPQSAASPQSEAQSVSPPQAQIVGNLGQQQSTQFSATVNNPAQNSGYIGSASSITTGYDMSKKKKDMDWGQFIIGFFAPIAVIIFLSIISEVTFIPWGLYCLLPLMWIVAIIVYFATGNESLGLGLVASIIVTPIALITGLML